MQTKYVLGAVLIFLLAACSSDPTKQETKPAMSEVDAKNGVECTYEIPVGSMIRQKKCTTLEQREAQRRQYEQLPTGPAPGSPR